MLHQIEMISSGNEGFFFGLLDGTFAFLTSGRAIYELCSSPPVSQCFQGKAKINALKIEHGLDQEIPGTSSNVKCFFLRELAEFMLLKQRFVSMAFGALEGKGSETTLISSVRPPHNLLVCWEQEGSANGWSMILK